MDAIGSAPWLALVLATLAVALAVVEAAVPGLGLAGGGAAVLSVSAGVVIWQADVAWWPLVLVVAASALWTLMIGWSRVPSWAQVAAAGLHAAGGALYGVLADDPASVAVAVVGASALAAGFPGLHGWTRRLVEQQPAVGMESLVGRSAVVQVGADDRPVVRLDGSLWSIRPTAGTGLVAGQAVVVRGWRGMVLEVAPPDPAGPAAGLPSAGR